MPIAGKSDSSGTTQVEKAITLSYAESIANTPISRKTLLQRFFIGIFVCLITCLAIEGFCRFIVVQAKPPLSYSTTFDRKFLLSQKKLPEKQPGILILGDSLIAYSLSPEFLGVKLQNAYEAPVQAQNLAVPSNTYEQDLLLLKASIKARKAKPSLVIINTHLRLFNENYYSSHKKTREQFQNSYLARCLSGSTTNWQSSLRCGMEKAFFVLRYRNFLKTELTSLSDTLFSPNKRLKSEPNLAVEVEFSPSGWMPAYSIFTDKQFEAEFLQPKHLKSVSADLSPFQWNDAHFKQFLSYCRKENIPVAIVWLPEHPINQKYYNRFHLPIASLTERLEQVMRSQNVRFYNLRNTISGTENYSDPEHLNAIGAKLVTEKIATILQQDYGSVLQANIGTQKVIAK
jgi:hypothetical protein